MGNEIGKKRLRGKEGGREIPKEGEVTTCPMEKENNRGGDNKS